MVGGDRRSPPRHRGKGGGGGGGKGNKGGGGHGVSKDGGAAMGVKSTQVFKVSGGSDDGKTKSATIMDPGTSALATEIPTALFMDGFGMKAVSAIINHSNSQSRDALKSQNEVSAQPVAHGAKSFEVENSSVAQGSSLIHDLHRKDSLDDSNLHKEESSFCENLHKKEGCLCENLHKECCLCENLHKESCMHKKEGSLCEVLHKKCSLCKNLHKESCVHEKEGSLCESLHKECSLCDNLHKESSAELAVHDFEVANSMSWAKSDAKVFNFSANLHKDGCSTMAMKDDSSTNFLHKDGEKPGMKTYVQSPIKNASNPRWADLVDNLDQRTPASSCANLFNSGGMELDNSSAVFPNSNVAISGLSTMEGGPNGQGDYANLHISGGGENRELNGADMNVDTPSSQGVCDNAIDKNSAFLHKKQHDSFWVSNVKEHRNVSQSPVRPHNINSERERGHPHARNISMQRPNAWTKPKHIQIHGEEVGSITRDGKVVIMNKDAVNHNIGKLRMALVGRLIGKKLPFNILDEELHRRWECFGEFNTVMIESDCFICTFQNHEARDAVLIGGPWQIAGHIIGLDKWTPKFKANSFSGLSSPVWIRFPHLPLMYWDATNITRIATMVGEPLWLDVQTSEWGRSAYARVCVRLELDKKLPTGVWVEGIDGDFFQKVMFEGISILCFKCGIIGHKDIHCTSKAPCDIANGEQVRVARQQFGSPSDPMVHANHGENGKVDIDATPSGIDDKLASVLNVEDDEIHGPWTLVSRRRKAIPKGKGRGDLSGRFNSKSSQNRFKGKCLDNASGPGGMLDSGLQTSRGVDCLQDDCAPIGSIEAITATSKSMQQGSFSFGATLEVGEPSKVGADLSPLKEVATHKSLKPRVGQSRVSKAHFEKELQSLGPIAELPRKRKKLSEGLMEDLAPDQLVNSRGQLLLTNTDGGDASPLDNG